MHIAPTKLKEKEEKKKDCMEKQASLQRMSDTPPKKRKMLHNGVKTNLKSHLNAYNSQIFFQVPCNPLMMEQSETCQKTASDHAVSGKKTKSGVFLSTQITHFCPLEFFQPYF